MLDKETMRREIQAAIEGSGHTHAFIAEELEVTVQAVTGWLRTGRIDKGRLPALARVTGVPLSRFMPGAEDGLPRRSGVREEAALWPPKEDLWAAYSRASQATQRAVDLLLLPPAARERATQGQRGLIACIELLELSALEALTDQKSA